VRTPEEVLIDKKGNCHDQTELAVAMMKALGYKAWTQCHQTCHRYRHCNGRVELNKRTIVFDTSCKYLNQL
jgi:transglutaminase-like putative cysteine protease